MMYEGLHPTLRRPMPLTLIRVAFRSLSAFRYLSSAHRLGAGGAA